MEPSASPVPGTMYPVSCRDSGVGRRDAVCAYTVIPRAADTLATWFLSIDIRIRQVQHTLASNTSISQDPNLPSCLIMEFMHVLCNGSPAVLFLRFMRSDVVPRSNEPVHRAPFRDWWAVDPGTGCEGDIGVLDTRVMDEMVKASGDSMDEFYTAQVSWLPCAGGLMCTL